jgi:hypothetical protein
MNRNNVKARKLLAILNHEEQSYARLNDKGVYWIGFPDYPREIIDLDTTMWRGGPSDQIILQYFLSENTVAPDSISRSDKSFWIFHMKFDEASTKLNKVEVAEKKQITRDQAIGVINWYERKRYHVTNDEGHNYNTFTAQGNLPVNCTVVQGDDGEDYRLITDGTLRRSNKVPVSKRPDNNLQDLLRNKGITGDVFVEDGELPEGKEEFVYLDWPVVKTRHEGKLYNLINHVLYEIEVAQLNLNFE